MSTLPPPEIAGVTNPALRSPSQVGRDLYTAMAGGMRDRRSGASRSATAAAAGPSGSGTAEVDGLAELIGLAGSSSGSGLEGWAAELAAEFGIDPSPRNLGQIGRRWAEEMDVRAFIEVQRRLWVLGMYGSSEVPEFGKMRPDTIDAIEQFFAYAMTDPEVSPFQQLLDATSGSTLFPDSEGRNGQTAMDVDPIRVALDNPDDLGRIIDEAYRNSLGRGATAEDKRAFVTAFHAYQRESYEADARYAMQAEDQAGPEGSDPAMIEQVQPVSPQTFTQEYVENADPTAFKGQRGIAAIDTISDNLGRA